MKRVLAGIGACAATGAASLGSIAFATPQQAPSHVIDRTVVCDVGLQGGIPVLNFRVESANRAKKQSAWAEMIASVTPTARLVSLSAGSIEISPACRPSTARVSLSTRGLKSYPPASIYTEEYDCWTPSRVLLRVRAVFRSPVRLKSGSPWGFPLLHANGKVNEAAFAVRTERGKPVALATMSAKGQVRVHLARGDCFLD